MSEQNPTISPAAEAAAASLGLLFTATDEKKNFIFEAGAGAGKTYSLVKALNHIIQNDGKRLLKAHQKVACISYTNVAKHQIDLRTDKHPVVHSDTIHAFCWSLIGTYQPELRKILPTLGEKWLERIRVYHNLSLSANNEGEEIQEVQPGDEIDFPSVLKGKPIIYQLGYPSIDDDGITLHHDDVLHMMVELLKHAKFRTLMTSKYPIIFIDEYQDTDSELADALVEYFIEPQTGPQLGFFGDHWQKIYGSGCGKIDSDKLLIIPKNANFRSVPAVVNVLNLMRPELRQEVDDPTGTGTAVVYHTNLWAGERRTNQHWNGDLPAEQAHNYLSYVWSKLEAAGWDFSPEKTKVLMLTHNVLAEEQGYRNLAGVFSSNDAYIKKEDKYLAFFMDVLEPMCEAFAGKRFGDMFSILGNGRLGISSHATKVEWSEFMTGVLERRENGTVGDVLDFIHEKKKPRLPESIGRSESKFRAYVKDELAEEEPRDIVKLRNLRAIQYSEVIAVTKFVNDHTPFATKHSIKGEEFENVLVVVGRGWNLYNFDQMINWFGNVPAGKEDTFERSRNLFYVACSRPKKNLAILFTQSISDGTMEKLQAWFGAESVIALEAVIPTLN